MRCAILRAMAPLLPLVLRTLFTGRRGGFAFTHQDIPLPPRPDDLNFYIHLPFCRHLCPFCPYVKQVFDRDTADAYRDALLRELDAWRNAWGPVPVASVYFGGGTPSMTPAIIEAVMSRLGCDLRPGAAVGVEVHPLDARPDVLRSLRACGVTMLSLGVQTYSDRLLRMLGRDYDVRRAREACDSALEAGFDGVDIDLIFAIPGQSVDEATADVAAAIATGAGQVSAYPLIQFSDTPLAGRLRPRGCGYRRAGRNRACCRPWCGRHERRVTNAAQSGASTGRVRRGTRR